MSQEFEQALENIGRNTVDQAEAEQEFEQSIGRVINYVNAIAADQFTLEMIAEHPTQPGAPAAEDIAKDINTKLSDSVEKQPAVFI